jgi:heme-degrading monooxygenase HmoA
MIVRKWRGWADKERADGYLQHFAAHVQAKLGTVRGYRKALVLTREQGGETEIVTMTFFDRLEDVKGFAGEQYDLANVDPVAQSFLTRYDKTVTHFEIAFELDSNASDAVS